MSVGGPRLTPYGKDDKRDANPEGGIELRCLVEEEDGQEYGVDRLEVVGEIDGECRNMSERLQLKKKRHDGEHRGKEEKPEDIGQGRDNPTWEDGGIDRNCQREDNATAYHLIEQHRATRLARRGLYTLAAERESSVDERGDDAETDAQTVARFEAEDESDANDGEEAKKEFAIGWTLLTDQWLDDCRHESDKGKADGSDGDVSRLDAAVVEHPVDREKNTATTDFQQFAPRHPMQHLPCPHDDAEHQRAQQHTETYQRQFVDGDELTEESRTASDEHSEVEAQIGVFLRRYHFSIRDYGTSTRRSPRSHSRRADPI